MGKLKGYGVWIINYDRYPLAIFRHEKQAEKWAQDNYPGRWILKYLEIPAIPFVTGGKVNEIKNKAAELAEMFSIEKVKRPRREK